MTKTEIMKEAHRIAREELEGDYQAKLSLALKMVWQKQKEGNNMNVNKFFLKDKERSEAITQSIVKDRKEFPQFSVEVIKNKLEGYKALENDMSDSLFSFIDPETLEEIKVKELASGLRIQDESGIVSGLTREQYKELKSYYEAQKKVNLLDL